jgi:hypothetical protein
MSIREAATAAIKAGLARKFDVIPDDVSGFRVQVWFREKKDGPEHCYESKPFDAPTREEMKAEAAKRLKRMGASEAQIKAAVKHV